MWWTWLIIAKTPARSSRWLRIRARCLFIEATFLHTEAATAAKKCHLTAHQAGFLARQARVKDLVPIHFSPRYADREQALREEARAAFLGGNGYRAD
jgi:ribonuclease BN (tRNA processing enzyme)